MALSRVAEGLFSAVIAGYVFYILFALLPEYQARRKLSRFISTKTARIVGDCMAICNEVATATGQTLDFRTSPREELNSVFSAVQLSSHPNMMVAVEVWATWFQYLAHQQDRTRNMITSLLQQNRFLEPELVDILTEIESCPFFFTIAMTLSTPPSNTTLQAWASSFERYTMLCCRLADWRDAQQFESI